MKHEPRIEELLHGDERTHETAVRLLVEAFDNPARYDEQRIRAELAPTPNLFYRKFFVAYRGDEVVGVGGVKSADWASNTHILYLSAVAPAARGKGVAKALVQARIDWVREGFAAGCILVSTTHKKRFAGYGFRPLRDDDAAGRTLMVLDFPEP